MKKIIGILSLVLLVVSSVTVQAMLSVNGIDDSMLMSSVPNPEENTYGLISAGSKAEDREFAIATILSGLSEVDATEIMIEYVYDDTIVDKLDLSLYQETSENDLVLQSYRFNSSVDAVAAGLNTSLASIYSRYLEKTNIPVKDPLWLIAIGSVEYNYTTNEAGVIFSFPVNIQAAANDPNYLLKYDWREVQRIGGDSAVLRRDGSSIGMLQITSGYGTNVDPVIPEDFGTIGSAEGRRSDCWLTLGDGISSGSAIIWKPGVNGDRWSPADNANIVYAVYDSALKRNPLSPELQTKYEKAILMMWAHNRGVGIMGDSYYIERSKNLAVYVPELLEYIESVRPARFTRSDAMMSKVRSVANVATDGDTYPVMALMSYLITECRYSGKW